MSRLFFMLVSLFLISTPYSFASDNIFNYAGLSATTNEDYLRRQYSTSKFQSNYVQLSDKDSHDYITSVSLAVTDQYRNIRIGFGKELPRKSDESRRFFYPPCQEIYSKLKQQYGKEGEMIEYSEEKMISRRFTWKLKNEELNLGCFKSGDNFLSESLSITLNKI